MKNDGSDFEIVGSIWCDFGQKIFVGSKNNEEYVYVINNHNYIIWELEDEDYEIIKDLNYFNDDHDDIYKKMSEYQEKTGTDPYWLYDHIRWCESNIGLLYYDKDMKLR